MQPIQAKFAAAVLPLLLMVPPSARAEGEGAPPPPVTAPVPDKSGYTLFNPVPQDAMRGFSTDRPTKSTLPYTVDAGHVQIETDLAIFAFGRQDGTRTSGWTLFDPTVKLGLTNTIDVEVQITPYQSVITTSGTARSAGHGWGDSYAKLKVNLLGDDGGNLAIALMPYVKVPTARAALGNGHVEGGVVVPVSITAPHGFTVVLSPEIDHLRNTATPGYHQAADFLVNVSHPVAKVWTVYGEVFVSKSFQTGDRFVTTFDAAVSLALSPRLQWDLGANIKLSGAVPGAQIYTGLSRRF